ncbi:hypothetical protein MRX96_047080 [Rhipicephalus microplus]
MPSEDGVQPSAVAQLSFVDAVTPVLANAPIGLFSSENAANAPIWVDPMDWIRSSDQPPLDATHAPLAVRCIGVKTKVALGTLDY